MADNLITTATQQINSVKAECNGILNKIKEFSPPDSAGHYANTFRLIATPMLYSAWERCFTLCHGITLRLIRDLAVKANDLKMPQRAAWLIKSQFYRSFIDKLKNISLTASDSSKGEFSLLCEFLLKLENWLNESLDQAIDTDDLVMTFSNVNPKVVEINAQVIGINEFDNFRAIKFGRLHDLVGRRNGIGHGAIVDAPSNDVFVDLIKFTEELVNDYCNVFIEWIRTTYTPVTRRARIRSVVQKWLGKRKGPADSNL